MRQRGGTFRLFVTLLLAVAVPFCCCDFHSWLSSCAPCETATREAAVEPVAHDHRHGSAHDHDSDHHADATTASTDGNESGPSPCGPGHGGDDDCSCGKQNTLLAVAKTTVKFPVPVMVAILSLPAIVDSGTPRLFRVAGRDLWVSARPSTTLLHLHCALTV